MFVYLIKHWKVGQTKKFSALLRIWEENVYMYAFWIGSAFYNVIDKAEMFREISEL